MLLRATLRWLWLFTGPGSLLLLLSGCFTPQTRARERSAALRQLSPADQQLVLSGRIREGLNKDAVYIAWGAPSRTPVYHLRQRSFDFWFYTQISYGTGGGFFGVSRDFHYPGGRGHFQGDNSGADDFYVTPVYNRGLPPPQTEVPYKKAVFENDRVVSFETLHDEPPAGRGN